MRTAVIKTYRQAAEDHARAIQFLTGAASVTVAITWCDDGPNENSLESATHTATCWGNTSSGKPIGSLPGDAAPRIALGHLAEVGKAVVSQGESIVRKQPEPTDEELDAVEQTHTKEEEARDDAHE